MNDTLSLWFLAISCFDLGSNKSTVWGLNDYVSMAKIIKFPS